MPNIYAILGAVAFYIGSLFAVGIYERSVRDDYWTAKITKDKLEAVQQAVTIERSKQDKANAVIKQQNDDLQTVNNRLTSQLNSLRLRANRIPIMPEVPRTSCEGATGAELSKPDAEFLAREAARADEIRAGLSACYNFIDQIK